MKNYEYRYQRSVKPAIAVALGNETQLSELKAVYNEAGQKIPPGAIISASGIDRMFGCSDRVHGFCENMKKSANSGERAANSYQQAGVYAELATFIHAAPGDLVFDAGCGRADLLTALKTSNGIGIDVNPYLLDKAEKLLRSHGLNVVNHGNPQFAFASRLGLYPTGSFLQRDLDKSGIHLYCDNILDFEVSKQALEKFGNKATILVTILPDVVGAHYNMEFIAQITETQPYKKDPLYVISHCIKNARKVLDPLGKIVLGVRMGELRQNSVISMIEERYRGTIKISGQKIIALPSEAEGGSASGQVNGISEGIVRLSNLKKTNLLTLEARLI